MSQKLHHISGKLAVANVYISTTGYRSVNEMLLNHDKVSVGSYDGPAIRLDDIQNLAKSQMLVSQQVINRTSKSVVVVMRSGIRQIVQPTTGSYDGTVLIRNMYIIPKNNHGGLDEFYFNSDSVNHPDSELSIIRSQYIEFRKSTQPDHMCMMIDAIVDSCDLDRYNAVYIHNRDIVLSILNVTDTPSHPFDCIESSKTIQDNMMNMYNGCGFSLEIVNNNGGIIKRFFSIGNEVRVVESISDTTRRDGVYFFDKNGSDRLITRSMTLEEADKKFGLYPSYELAVSGGNANARYEEERIKRERELEEFKHNNKILQTRADNDKIKYEQDLVRLKNQLAESEVKNREKLNQLDLNLKESEHARKVLQENLDMERLQFQRRLEAAKDVYAHRDLDRKDYYDRRSYDRKDTSEIIKFWPVALTAAIGVFAYLSKTK